MIVREYGVKVNNQNFYCERDLWVQLFGEIGSDGLQSGQMVDLILKNCMEPRV